jgi:hypothetical protein
VREKVAMAVMGIMKAHGRTEIGGQMRVISAFTPSQNKGQTTTKINKNGFQEMNK